MFYIKFHVDANESYWVYSIRSFKSDTEFLLRVNNQWVWVDAQDCVPLE